MSTYLTAFIVGGLFCLVGQLLFDLTSSPGAYPLGRGCRGILGSLGLRSL